MRSLAKIGYPCWQDETIWPAPDYPLPPAKRIGSYMPYKAFFISFIAQACSVKMVAHFQFVNFWVFMNLVYVLVHKHVRKEFDHYPAILTSRLPKIHDFQAGYIGK